MSKTTRIPVGTAEESNMAGKVAPIKKPRVRSPNYPVVGLEKAVELMAKLNQKLGKHPIPTARVAR